MSEYIELAKKCGARITYPKQDCITFSVQQLAAYSESLRAKGREELAATQRVMEQMREALLFAHNRTTGHATDGRNLVSVLEEALAPQVSTDALREHDAKVLEDAACVFDSGDWFARDKLRKLAAELRAANKKENDK